MNATSNERRSTGIDSNAGGGAQKGTDLARGERVEARYSSNQALAAQAEAMTALVCSTLHFDRVKFAESRRMPIPTYRAMIWARLLNAGFGISAIGRQFGRTHSTIHTQAHNVQGLLDARDIEAQNAWELLTTNGY